MKLVSLILLVAGIVAAQSAPSPKNIPAIAKAANGAVVSIIMSDTDGQPIAQGTGFLISKDGRIVTNYHVIASGSSAIVKFPDGAFFLVDGVLEADKTRDVAVIKAHGEHFRTLALGNSDRLQVGEEIVAIGNPLSLESTVSNGIVSGIRTVEEQGGKFLQITAPISPGSSGGPLFNMAGEVVGITTLHVKGGENLNFAIPINDAKGLLLAGPWSKYQAVQPFPNEKQSELPSAGEKDDKDRPSLSDRDYYKRILDADGFYEPIGHNADGSPIMGQNANYACFSDDPNSGAFFSIVARAYDENFIEATRKGLQAVRENNESEEQKELTILRAIQNKSYISFLSIVDFNGFGPDDQQFFRRGGRTLFEATYEKGVKVDTRMYHWDGASWSVSIPETDTAANTRKSTVFQLSIEPSTMRYVRSATISTIMGAGLAAVADEKHFGPWRGVCETVPFPR